MIEKIARWLRVYKLQEVEVDNETEDGIVPWDKASQETRDFWLKDTKELLALISEDIEKVEKQAENTPRYWDGLGKAYQDGWENACQAILSLLRPIKKEV